MKLFLKTHIARVVNLVMLFVVIWTIFNLKYYNTTDRVIEHDVKSYYAYLPAAFIHGDLKLRFMDDDRKFYHQYFWPMTNADGERVIKTSMGMSYLYAPFFLAGHWAAGWTGAEQNGFSAPYKLALSLSSIFFFAIGLYFLRKTLLRHFSQSTTAVTTVCIVLGTNLFYYATIQMTYSHVYSFALIALFLYLLEPWLEHGKWKHTIALGLLTGLIVLIRPTNVLVVLLFVLWGVVSFKAFQQRFVLLWQRKIAVLVMIALAFVVWIPQFLYWHHVTSDWLYFSYGEERFFFGNPQFWKGLFSYQKGWLLYTPMMVLAFVGLFITWRKKREWRAGLTVFIFLNMYIIFSWWCWWYGGSFGQRPFVDSYALMALPLAVFFWQLKSWHRGLQVLMSCAIVFIVVLNLFQTRQVYGGYSMHHDAMSKEAYWSTFLTRERPENWEELLKHPDYEAAMKGIYVYKDAP